MLRSMYAGVSGLRVHQTKMDVIGNNIANVNTVGYKGSRVTFKEMLNQTIRAASQPSGGRGGLNPMQVGLGVSLGSIDADLSQGNLQATGIMTDLAIQGNGFFVVNDGGKNMYTRAGSFTFDQMGNLIHSTTGFKVQGWMADKQGKMPSFNPSTMTNLTLGDVDMPPTATTYVTYKGNLDSNKDKVDLSYGPTKTTLTDIYGNMAEFYIETRQISGDMSPERSDDRWEWTALTDMTEKNGVPAIPPIASSAPVDLPGKPVAGTFDRVNEGTVVVKNTATGQVYVENVDYVIDYDAGTIQGVVGGAFDSAIPAGGIDISYTFKDVIGVGEVSVDEKGAVRNSVVTSTTSISPDQIQIHLRDGSGAPKTLVEIKAPANGDATGGFFDVVTAGINGKMPEGEYGPLKTTSMGIYDSKGNKHELNISFLKTGENRYDWFATGPVDGSGNPLDLTGASGTLYFDSQGKLLDMPTGGPISFQPSGAERMVITPDFNAITQFAAEDTAVASNCDGYEAGSLQAFSVDGTGTIIGQYSNGMNQEIAKLAVASFSNTAGLTRDGDTVFMESNNSGVADVGVSGVGGKGLISPGTLEMSNVDLADQFTEMITTQRGFQASSKIISTADQILQDLVNLKR